MDDLFTLPDWIDDSLCSKVGNPDDWFPHATDDPSEAVAVCKTRCPVRAQCLDLAMRIEVDEDGGPRGKWSRYGIYGGLTPFERFDLASGAA